MWRILSRVRRSGRWVRRQSATASRAVAIDRHLSLETLELKAMLANVAPVAVNDTLYFAGFVQQNVAEGSDGLLANDYDPDERLTVEVVNASQAAQYGTLEVSEDRAVIFWPRDWQVGGQCEVLSRVL
jgi:hypothetical protein